LKGSVPKTWVYGNAYLRGGPVTGVHDAGTTYQTSRSPTLLSGGDYFTMAPPTYQEYSVDQIVNIKAVKGFPVHGDGQTVSFSSLVREYEELTVNSRMTRTTSISFSPEMQTVQSLSSQQEPTWCQVPSISHQDPA
jgi:hypothetical protein